MTGIDFLSSANQSSQDDELVERVAGALRRQIVRYRHSGAKGGLLVAYEAALEASADQPRRSLLVDRIRFALRDEDFQFSRILRESPSLASEAVRFDGEPRRRFSN